MEIKGTLKFTGELTFEGKLEGDIQADGTLHLGESAVVAGDINATSVNVRGKVNGNITAREKVEIKTKGEVFGDVKASRLSVEEGVTMVGRTEVNPNKVAPSSKGAPPVQPTRGGDSVPKTAEVGKGGER